MKDISRKKILIIDDDLLFCNSVSEYLSEIPVDITSVSSGKKGLEICNKESIDIVLLDQKLPDISGTELYPSILEKNDQTKIIFITAFPDLKNAVSAVKKGAYDYISKPFEPEELTLAIHKAIHTINLENVAQLHNYHQKRETDAIHMIGSSPAMEILRHMIDIASESAAPVIITGETGTGKNMAAKAIHYKKFRNNEPFISVNCAALPENLIEAELFGVEKGAYTGADKSRKGLFELAEGGTLLLDEIGELPSAIQSKLLGVLDEKKIKRVGGQKSIDVNVRVIAATNVEIEDAVSKKTFRKDLYYRLSIIRIHVPPLRERYTDIPAVVDSFITGLVGKKILSIGQAESEKLMKYQWPGNIRELRNIIERAIILRKGDEIFPSAFIEKGVINEIPAIPPGISSGISKTLKEVEKEHILFVLNKNSNNYTKTARELGISRSTLMRKLEKYNWVVIERNA